MPSHLVRGSFLIPLSGGLRGEERTIAISSGALFLFARRFDGGMPAMRDGVLGLELVVNYSYSSSSQLSLDGSECKEKEAE